MSIASHHVVITGEYQHHIIITANDRLRLLQLLQREFKEITGCKAHLDDLLKELHRASIVDPADVPGDVVTMDSVVELTDLDSNDREIYTLVYPDCEDVQEKMLSVFAPIGTAILGCRVGDIVSWPVPIGECRMKIENIFYQPEHYEVG
ncbi:Regulator of nucleoside diphosphate kinase [Stieleria maiorica]|uniref:Regulator of nucleoside diphosphate kinase n=1 Tax=Stieleria maiorica TaxID=2795974 RepID=A0A5B9MFE2_9BACT|nr:GreA/GreB family elongation factor [Stieleria maiorica]QEF97837.1 Regulator of nucleoside diphosphate kinase [Stieleria maiorica]